LSLFSGLAVAKPLEGGSSAANGAPSLNGAAERGLQMENLLPTNLGLEFASVRWAVLVRKTDALRTRSPEREWRSGYARIDRLRPVILLGLATLAWPTRPPQSLPLDQLEGSRSADRG
jgi:hypothetical protein